MKTLYERRACVILYNLLKSQVNQGIFLLPANVCPIVVATFIKAERKFELLDIHPTHYCLDENLVLEKIKKNPSQYAGILFVRTYGLMTSFETFFENIKKEDQNILVIDDRCLAPISFEVTLGSADVVLYSTGYSKFVDLGFGGLGLIQENVQYNKQKTTFSLEALTLLDQAFRGDIQNGTHTSLAVSTGEWLDTREPEVTLPDYQSRVEKYLTSAQKLKAEFNQIYSNELPACIQMSQDYQNWRFNIRVDRKEDLLKLIFGEGLFASSHYFPASRLYFGQPAPNSDALYSQVINLFSDRYFTLEKAQKLTQLIQKHLNYGKLIRV